jgi:Mg-chelatase subunit ChlD
MDIGSLPEKEVAKGHLSILYRMIGHTRDIIDGKGEYTLSYMMLFTWYNFYPKLVEFALTCFVVLPTKTEHQYGSWKDLKYFCQYCKDNGLSIDHPLIQFSITLINKQLKTDFSNMTANSNDVSLAAKWAPREKSSFGWLYEALATNYFNQFLETANSDERRRKAVLKCKTEYRKLLSALNRFIDTLQIKQCQQTWQNIDFNKVTSISLIKQKKAFLNIKKDGKPRHPDNMDRKQCADNFNVHIQKAVKGEVEMKGKRVSMADFTKQACQARTQAEKDLLNSQWRDNSSQNGALGKMIAMVDVSGSMEGDPMNVAIALGIRIAEKSALGKRVMTFSSKPTWVNLEPYPDFISQVNVVKQAEWGMNTNFHAALDMILDAIVENKMASEDVQDMVLVILSDMQMDSGDNCDKNALYEKMKNKYADAGVRVNGIPYKPPHILFWNLRSTSGFPSLSDQPNASMMSGFNPSLLNLFCEQGMDALQSCTPWSLLVKSLDNDRYTVMAHKIEELLV